MVSLASKGPREMIDEAFFFPLGWILSDHQDP